MPIQINNVTRRVVYAASGTGPYAFTFEILAAGDIAVYRDDTLLTITTDYTVTIASNGTGSITLTAAPTGATQIAIVGNRTIQRTTDFTTGGDFFANTLNDELDQQTIFAQQNAEGLARALQAPQTDPTTINMVLPKKADRAGKYLAFDANGNPAPGDTSVDISLVASNISNINTVKGQITPTNNIATVAGANSNITTVAGISSNITTVAGISGNVTTVAGISANVTSVAGNSTNINTVAGAVTNVNKVATDIANVNTVAGELGTGQDVTVVAADLSGSDNIGTVAGSIADVNTLGPIAADISAVADIAADVSAVENISSNVTTVAGIAANVTTVAGNSSNVTTVAGISANVTTVAGISSAVSNVSSISSAVSGVNSNSSNINTVAGISGDVTTVAGISADVAAVENISANVTTVAGISSNVTTVAGISSNVTTVANNSANVTTVAGISANVTTVAGISADVTTVATNVADITNFADVYQGPKTANPSTRNDTTALQSGDLYFNTVANEMRVYNGSAWQTTATLPDLIVEYEFTATAGQTSYTFTGGYRVGFTYVWVNGVMLSDADITATDGNTITFGTALSLNDEVRVITFKAVASVTAADVGALATTGGTLTGNLTLNAQSDLRFADSDSSNWLAFQAPGTVASNITWTLPSADGSNGQVLQTNGSGTLSWSTPSTGITTGKAIAMAIVFGG
jgi:hypothetical protein